VVYYRNKEWVDLRALSQVMAAPPNCHMSKQRRLRRLRLN